MSGLLNKTNLIQYFEKGIKKNSQQKIGTEHEKFILDKSSLLPLRYSEPNGIKDIFLELIKLGWKPIKEGEHNNIIGLVLNNQSISLEPAGQFELSGASLDNIHQTCDEITNHLQQMKKIASDYKFILLGIGVEPNLGLQDFTFMPKDRYSIMKDYMPTVGKHGQDMMQRTCSTQVNLDYCSEEDMIKKFRVLLSLESIGTAIFANSPFLEGKLSEYKSLRSLYWIETDKQRTGITPFVFNEDFNFETYVDYALDVPMYFIKRKNKYINLAGKSFRSFMNGELDTLSNDVAIEEDWANHLSTLFPQVRLKQYLELRSMDACSWSQICGQPAFWTGLLYDTDCLDEVYAMISKWTHEDRFYLYNNVPKYGLDTVFKNTKVLDIAKKVLKISQKGLKKRERFSKDGYDESKYLEKVEANLNMGVSPADILIDQYKHQWKESVEPIYEEHIF